MPALKKMKVWTKSGAMIVINQSDYNPEMHDINEPVRESAEAEGGEGAGVESSDEEDPQCSPGHDSVLELAVEEALMREQMLAKPWDTGEDIPSELSYDEILFSLTPEELVAAFYEDFGIDLSDMPTPCHDPEADPDFEKYESDCEIFAENAIAMLEEDDQE